MLQKDILATLTLTTVSATQEVFSALIQPSMYQIHINLSDLQIQKEWKEGFFARDVKDVLTYLNYFGLYLYIPCFPCLSKGSSEGPVSSMPTFPLLVISFMSLDF